jgi:hypothetical protein
MSALSDKSTALVTAWANEHGWYTVRRVAYLPFEPFGELQMDKRYRVRDCWEASSCIDCSRGFEVHVFVRCRAN